MGWEILSRIIIIVVASIYYNWKFRKVKRCNRLLLEGLKIECNYSEYLESCKEKLLKNLMESPIAWKKFKKRFKIKI